MTTKRNKRGCVACVLHTYEWVSSWLLKQLSLNKTSHTRYFSCESFLLPKYKYEEQGYQCNGVVSGCVMIRAARSCKALGSRAAVGGWRKRRETGGHKAQREKYMRRMVSRTWLDVCSHPPKAQNHHATCVCVSTVVVCLFPQDVIILRPLSQQRHEHRTQQDTHNHK